MINTNNKKEYCNKLHAPKKDQGKGCALKRVWKRRKRAFCCDHYRKDVFSKVSETRKEEISTPFPQFLLADWKEGSTRDVSEDELCAVVLTWVQQHHQKAWSRWQARGWGVDCRDSRSNKGEHWLLELQMCRDMASPVFSPPLLHKPMRH